MKSPQEFLSNRFRQFLRTLTAYGIAALFVLQVALGFPFFQWNLTAPMLEPNRTAEEKLRIAWGAFFDAMQFVQVQTPLDAVILIDSNYIYFNLTLYFLYPRKLLFGGETIFRANPEIGYVLITDGYPDFPVAGETTMLNDKHGLLRILR